MTDITPIKPTQEERYKMQLDENGNVTFITEVPGLIVSTGEAVATIMLDVTKAEFQGLNKSYHQGDIGIDEIRDNYAIATESEQSHEKIEPTPPNDTQGGQ